LGLEHRLGSNQDAYRQECQTDSRSPTRGPEKIGKGLMFISLNVEPEMQVAALDRLRAELEAKGVPVKEGSWGYRLLVVDAPDGNQLFFNYPNETASGKTV
jgi:hypothetical protein